MRFQKFCWDSRDSTKIPKIPKILERFQRFQRFWKDSKDSGKIPKIPKRFQRNDTRFHNLFTPRWRRHFYVHFTTPQCECLLFVMIFKQLRGRSYFPRNVRFQITHTIKIEARQRDIYLHINPFTYRYSCSGFGHSGHRCARTFSIHMACLHDLWVKPNYFLHPWNP